MRRHTKKGFTPGDIQFRINVAYGEEQKRRAAPDAKFPGCNAKGWPIHWAPCDRFTELNHLAYERGRFKWLYAHASRDVFFSEIARLHRILNSARFADRPRLP